MANEAPTLRETLQSAIEEHSTGSVESEGIETAEEEAGEASAEPVSSIKSRDDQGRFSSGKAQKESDVPAAITAVNAQVKAKAAGPGTPPPESPAAKAEESTPAPIKAPQSWRPQIRELAQRLPAEFRPIVEESLKREAETSRALQESAQSRRLAEQVHQTVAPYEMLARAAGMDPISYAGSLLQTAAALHTGAPAQRAQIVAHLIKSYGVDPGSVADALDGQLPQAATQQQQRPVDIQAEVQRALASQVEQYQVQSAENSLREFMATEPKYLSDVWRDMQAVLHSAAASNQNVTYQEAYDRACWMNPEVRGIMESKKAVQAAKAQAPSIAKAKLAASSVKAAPVERIRPQGERTLREELIAAMAEHSRT